MLWTKALHLIFMVTWFAGLFYLPRLFVYHAQCEDQAGIERFKLMERKLYYVITTPGAVLTLLFGTWTLALSGWEPYAHSLWMPLKLLLVLLLTGYHLWCGKLLSDFRQDRNRHSQAWYRWFNEVPTFFLVAIIILAVVRPV
jgi:putative membrane protein